MQILNRVLLIDATQLLYRSAFAQGKVLGIKEPLFGPGTICSVLGVVRQAVYRFCPLVSVLVWDGGRSIRRKEISPGYKSGRQIPTVESTNQKWFDIGRLIPLLNRLGCRSVVLPNREADDVIGFIAGRCVSPVIISADQDFLQLVQRGSSCWFPDKDKYVSGVNFFEEFGILPNQYLLYKCILGDSGDSIPGVSRVGEKTILPILQSDPTIISFGDLRRTLLGRGGSLSKRERLLLESEEVVLRNENLMDLCREVFLPEEIQKIENVLGAPAKFEESVREEIHSLGMSIVSELWVEWSSPFRRLLW